MTSSDNLKLILSSFMNNRPIQSLLFIGPEGALKFSTAKNLAKSLNCLDRDFDFCNSCINCKKIDDLTHLDVHIYGLTQEHIKISDIHNLQKFINMRPYEAKKKIFIIKDADNLTNDAANCLLKTLEEPTKDSVIILTTSKVSKIFLTIISRCQRFYFGMPSSDMLKDLFKNKLGLSDSSAQFFALFSEGREPLALKLKEKNFLDVKNRIIDLVFIDKTLTKISGDFEQRQEFKLALMVILSVLRDILFIKLSAPADDLINLDRLNLLLKIKDDFTFDGVLNIFDEILKLSLNIEQNVNLKLIFDILVLKIDENRLSGSVAK